ncbi:MAG: formimidoylglutamase [Rhodothermales bacterium]|nr:formimidoylglutamase [Rhodothermales bacterium]
MNYQVSDFDEWSGHSPGTDDDPRLGDYVSFSPGGHQEILIAMAGFPVDDGVRTNGGRVGAAHAPDDIRKILYRMTPDGRRSTEHVHVLQRTLDVGNLRAGRSLVEKQESLGQFVRDCLLAGVLPVILGGGHETAYGHFLGYMEADRSVNILNLDAHADVRPLVRGKGHSGSPFRQALDHPSGKCLSYSVAGLQPGRNASAHLAFLAKRSARVYWVDDTTEPMIERLMVPANEAGPVMLSLDMDVVDQSYAPGVSAPTVGGIEQRLLIDLALTAGATPSVTSVDLVEVNPMVDEGGRTIRLAAHVIWSFLLGFAERT